MVLELRIAICVPVLGDTKAKFTKSLARMIAHTAGSEIKVGGALAKPVFEYFDACTSTLIYNRQKLLADAMNWRADYILMLDADHVFPPDTLMRLLGHSKQVVGVNYPARYGAAKPTATRIENGEHVPVRPTEAALEEVASLGLGICLVNKAAIDALLHHQGRVGRDLDPVFQATMTREGDTIAVRTEDVAFFDHLTAAGVKIYCDNLLSMEAGHITEEVRRF